MQWYDILLIVVMIGIGLLAGWKYLADKTKKKYRFKQFLRSPIFAGGMILILAAWFTPANLVNDSWVWQWGGNINNVPTQLSGSHLQYNGEKQWFGIDGTFTIVDGFDNDGFYPSTNVASVTGVIYRGSISAQNYKLFLENKLSFDHLSMLSGLQVVESFTASSGVVTTTGNSLNSGEEVLIKIGTVNADETGNYPLKSQFYRAVVQGDDSTSKPSTVNIGTGRFAYYSVPDEDELTLTLLTGAYGAVAATTLDWSDETDNIFDLVLKITFADDECGMLSYYDETEDQWWNWYIVVDFNEHNATNACTTVEALVPSTTSYADGYAASNDGLHQYIQLSSPHIFTSNAVPDVIGYNIDASGAVIKGWEANQFINIRWDLSSVTRVGTIDNNQEFKIDFDLGTGLSISSILASGALPADTDNNYHVSGAATYYIVV